MFVFSSLLLTTNKFRIVSPRRCKQSWTFPFLARHLLVETVTPRPQSRSKARSPARLRAAGQTGSAAQQPKHQRKTGPAGSHPAKTTTNRQENGPAKAKRVTKLTCKFLFCPTKCRRSAIPPCLRWRWSGRSSQHSPLHPEDPQQAGFRSTTFWPDGV